jgi:chromosomal replication initiation ATPase DnaA
MVLEQKLIEEKITDKIEFISEVIEELNDLVKAQGSKESYLLQRIRGVEYMKVAELLKTIIENYYGVSLTVKSRKPIYVRARTIYVYIAKALCPSITLETLAEEVGKKDHSTMCHAINTIFPNDFMSNAEFREQVFEIIQKINAAGIIFSLSYDEKFRLQKQYQYV